MRVRGVLAVEPDRNALADPEQRRLLDTCASLLAISLERIHYIEVAQSSTVQIESERLRNSLLAAHLARPAHAAGVAGRAGRLAGADQPAADAPSRREIADAMRDAALRMNALVNNLLDMARLEAGEVQLNRQWQPLEEVVGSALQSHGRRRCAARPVTSRCRTTCRCCTSTRC